MRVFSRKELIEGMVDHPYDTNPDLVARVNFFYYSADGKLAMAYYESPPGWFDVEVEGFDEIDYVLEGEVELRRGTEKLTARAGDAFLIQDGDKLHWEMKKPSRMVFFIYPLTQGIRDLISAFNERRQ